LLLEFSYLLLEKDYTVIILMLVLSFFDVYVIRIYFYWKEKYNILVHTRFIAFQLTCFRLRCTS